MKSILWEGRHSIEYFCLATQDNMHILEGTVVLLLDDLPTKVLYKIECDLKWNTRAVVVQQDRSGDVKHLRLSTDDRQIWQADGSIVSSATTPYDVDLEITPATNTLPVRRTRLQEGESQQIDVLWIRFPSLAVEQSQQRYTRVDQNRYLFELSATGYRAMLEVDELGLIIAYNDLWQRTG